MLVPDLATFLFTREYILSFWNVLYLDTIVQVM
jgi:hypothetical protein